MVLGGCSVLYSAVGVCSSVFEIFMDEVTCPLLTQLKVMLVIREKLKGEKNFSRVLHEKP